MMVLGVRGRVVLGHLLQSITWRCGVWQAKITIVDQTLNSAICGKIFPRNLET